MTCVTRVGRCEQHKHYGGKYYAVGLSNTYCPTCTQEGCPRHDPPLFFPQVSGSQIGEGEGVIPQLISVRTP